jgi:ribosome-binding factor A
MGIHRASRLNEQLRREITDIVRTQLRDPRIGAVTVTDVRVTADLDFARVFFTTLEPDAAAASLEGLRAAAAYIRGELGRRLHIRHIPELRFQPDETLEHARRIESLLAQVRPPATPPAAGAEGDAVTGEADQRDDDG